MEVIQHAFAKVFLFGNIILQNTNLKLKH